MLIFILVLTVVGLGTLLLRHRAAAEDSPEWTRAQLPTNMTGRAGGFRAGQPHGGGAKGLKQYPPGFEPELPLRIGENAAVQQVVGSSTTDTYSVDVKQRTCTCPDFASRSALPMCSVGRLCKHLRREVVRFYEEGAYDELLSAILRQTGKHHYRVLSLPSGGTIVVGYSLESNWLDVLARTRRKGEREGKFTGPYSCFGYSIVEHRWSYASGPPNAREIREAIARMLV